MSKTYQNGQTNRYRKKTGSDVSDDLRQKYRINRYRKKTGSDVSDDLRQK